MGEVIAFEELVRMRRRRATEAVHLRCRAVLQESVWAARTELGRAAARDRLIWAARVRKLEALEDYATALG
jgi:hypothetical protein